MKLSVGTIVIVAGVAVVVILLIVALLHSPATVPPAPVQQAATPEASATPLKGNLTLQGTKLTNRDAKGNVEWSLQADTAIKFDPARKVAEGQKAHWLLQRGPSTDWEVDAPVVLFRYETGDLEFTNGVQLYSTDRKQRFSVKRLVYVPGSKELRGEGPVRFTAGAATVTADHMVVQTANKQVRLEGDVHFNMPK